AELVLHMMPDLMRDHVGLRELTGARAGIAAFEAALDIAEKRCVEIDLLIARTIERPHRGLRHAALVGARRAGEHHQRRRPVALAGLFEDQLPLHVRAAENARDELAHVIARRAGLAPALRRLLLLAAPR